MALFGILVLPDIPPTTWKRVECLVAQTENDYTRMVTAYSKSVDQPGS